MAAIPNKCYVCGRPLGQFALFAHKRIQTKEDQIVKVCLRFEGCQSGIFWRASNHNLYKFLELCDDLKKNPVKLYCYLGLKDAYER